MRTGSRSPQALLADYRPDLALVLEAEGLPSFRHSQVLEHLFRRHSLSFSEATNLPADLRAELDRIGASVLSLLDTRTAPDGTAKLLLEARDGARIEAVLMPYGDRVTACISSQVGCAVSCGFCATGGMGFRRNLTTAEIVDQLREASRAAATTGRRISNVVYMGMGEPLLNLGSVLDSVRVFTSPLGFGLGHRSLSVSTVGIPAGILRLARAEPQVNLALSLHAADDATRALLIPDRYRHPLADILDAAWQHFSMTRRKLLVEYILFAGINDSIDDARRLAALLRRHVVAVNLMSWNPVCAPERDSHQGRAGAPASGDRGPGEKGRPAGLERPVPAGGPRLRAAAPPMRVAGRPVHAAGQATGRTLHASPPAAIAAFRAVLRDAHIEAVVRRSKGAGIEAACGQLAADRRSYDGDHVTS